MLRSGRTILQSSAPQSPEPRLSDFLYSITIRVS